MPLRTVDDYGGLKVNVQDPEYPEGEESAEEGNRKAVDLATFSSTSPFACCMFTPTTDAPGAGLLLSPAVVTIRSHAGNGSSAKPTVTKTATGLYTIAWPSTYADAMVPTVTEDITIRIARANYSGAVLGFARVTNWTLTTVDIALVNSSLVASDMSAAGSIILDVNY